MQFRAPRGTNDFLPDEAEALQKVEEAFRGLCRLYGYREIRTPAFEQADLFVRTTGQTTDIVTKEMYLFQDRGGRQLALRPEVTPPVVRAYLEHGLYAKGSQWKFFYIGPIFRYERPQAGRYRQHTQLGAEVLGSSDPRVDAEVIDLNLALLSAVGLADVSLEINSIGCPNCRPAYRAALLKYCEGIEDALCDDCLSRMHANPLRLFDCKQQSCHDALADAPEMLSCLCEECRAHFQSLQRTLESLGHAYQIQPRLVRGLDYYTKTVFEVSSTSLGAQKQLSGGGRYDGLVEDCGGPPTPGVGFGAGLERIALIAPPASDQGAPAVFVAAADKAQRDAVFSTLAFLRRHGVASDTDFADRNLRGQLKEADRRGCSFVLIIGEEELASGLLALRDMRTGDQRRLTLEQIVQEVLNS
jgi:histidyl-tRNA synthetase